MILVDITDKQRAIQQAVRELVQRVIAPKAAEIDEQERFPVHTVEAAREHGLLAMPYPEHLGGMKAGTLTISLVLEEIARGCGSSAVTLMGHFTGALGVLLKGGEEQQRRFLAPDGQPTPLWAVCITEPGAGSDVGSIATTARKTGSGYVLNGTKRFVTNGGHADHYLVFARTGGEERHRSLSAFILSRDTAGLHPGKPEKKMGLRGSATTDLVLEDVEVSMDRLVGREGEGFELVAAIMERTRANVAAIALGLAEAALQYAFSYAQERQAFGRPIAGLQGVQFLLVDMMNRVESARLLTYWAATLADRRSPDAPYYSAMAKRTASDVALSVTADAVQILGGNGYMREYPVERMMRDAKATQIFEGTNQIQQLVIWKHALKHGLPFVSQRGWLVGRSLAEM